MLVRICNSSLKIVRFAHIVNNASFHRVPALIHAQHKCFSDYTKSAPSFAISQSLEAMLRDYKVRLENRNLLTQHDWEKLAATIKKQTVSSQQALEFFRLCSFGRVHPKSADIVFDIWKHFKDQENFLEISHYNYLLQFARDKSNCQQTQQIFDELIKNGLKPNFVSYQCLLKQYCQDGNIEKAVDVLDMMNKDNMQLNVYAFNDLALCQIICGDIENAKSTMEKLKEAGFKVLHSTLTELLKFYSKNGDMENVEKTIELFKEENVELMNRDILQAICELTANGHADKIELLYKHLNPNIEMKRSLLQNITTFVEKKQSNIVPKIIKLFDNQAQPLYKHLISEMCRLSSSSEEIDEVVKSIEADGFTVESNFEVFEPALQSTSINLIRKLLIHMKNTKQEVNESSFEKIFQTAAQKGPEDVLKSVKLMCQEFKIRPRITFIRDFILPGMNANEKPEIAFVQLVTNGVSERSVVIAIANNSLTKNNFKTAYNFLSSTQTDYNSDIIKRPLLAALAETGDVKNFVAIVRVIHNSFLYSKASEKLAPTEKLKAQQDEFVDNILFSAITQKEYDPKFVTALLKAFADEGLAITRRQSEKILLQIKENRESNIGRLLTNLSNHQLELKPFKIRKTNIMSKISSIDFKNILEVKQGRGDIEKYLFLAYVREGNIADIEPLLASGRLNLTSADFAQLIELYTRVGDADKALQMLERVTENNKSFRLDAIKVAKLVTLMFDKSKNFDQIDAVLLAHRPPNSEFRIFIFEHLLDKLASAGSHEQVNNLYDSLVKYNYVKPTNETLGPLISSYLNSGLYSEAIEKLEVVTKEHKLFPMSMVVFKSLIEKNEIDLLQRVYDIYENLYGESNALARLAFAFIECNREAQAKAIFENEGLKNISKHIARECRKYVEFNRIEAAKILLSATRSIYCERNVIYDTILDIYINQNLAKEALDLWVDVANDGILPSKKFIHKLSDLLTANNIEIPYDLKSKITRHPKPDKKEATN